MYLVTVPEGCVCKAGGFRFISIGNLGMFRSAVQVENTFDIRETLQIIGNQEMSQIFNDFDKEEKRVVKVENILSTFEHRKALDEAKPGAHHVLVRNDSDTRGLSHPPRILGRLETMPENQTRANR